eukprot:TRINITY_DN5855_c1_g1_i1.p2 TRINITY_DN5855_c1_g1~~TRINITY_DN5855_c1_g1_i1.p2  ORF type:complete len:151 (+),score=28.40 TRINITY_DN5855_c1_g1_i1:1930-2382(+)
MVSAEKNGPFMANAASKPAGCNSLRCAEPLWRNRCYKTAAAKNHASARWFLFDDSRCQALTEEDDDSPATSSDKGKEQEEAGDGKEPPTVKIGPTLASPRLVTPAAYVLCYAAADTPASDLLKGTGAGADENGEDSDSDPNEEGTYYSVA